MPRHVDEARALGGQSFEAELGDARSLEAADDSCEVVLLMGPLYHLVEGSDRLLALREARRVAKPGGMVVAVGISRFASFLDGLRFDRLRDPDFRLMVEEDLRTGQHRNPRPAERPEWFTTAYFHRPDELVGEVTQAGLKVEAVLGIEGPGWLVGREVGVTELAHVARSVENEPSVVGASAHIMVIARRLAT